MTIRMLMAGVFGGFLSLTAMADPSLGGMQPPPAPPPPSGGMPPASAPAAGGITKSTTLNDIKAIFDTAKVSADIMQLQAGLSAVHTNLGGYDMIAVPVDCANNDQASGCGAVVLISGAWNTKITPQQLADMSWKVQQFSTIVVSPEGKPQLRYAFSVSGGIGPEYIETAIVNFAYDMKNFGAVVTSGKQPGSFAKMESKGGVKNEPFAKTGVKVELGVASKKSGTGLYISP